MNTQRSAMPTAPAISIVVPAYNEAASLPLLLDRLHAVLANEPSYEILVVDDGSTDGTLPWLRRVAAERAHVRFVSFSRNFGHQSALRAGLDFARGRCIISLDADLQHPPELIPELLAQWRAGAQVVLTVRSDEGTSWLKRTTAALYYRLLSRLTDRPPDAGAADFRLLDRAVVDRLRDFPERTLFLRGLMPWIGFQQARVHYRAAPRAAGETKYPLRRMLLFGLEGVVATSTRPLLLASLLGVFVSLFAALYAVYAAYMRLARGTAITGWASVIVFMALLGGAQLFVLGILGVYVGRILREVQQRPAYLVKEQSASPTDDRQAPHGT